MGDGGSLTVTTKAPQFFPGGPAYADNDRWRQAVDELSNRESTIENRAADPPDSAVIDSGQRSDQESERIGAGTRATRQH